MNRIGREREMTHGANKSQLYEQILEEELSQAREDEPMELDGMSPTEYEDDQKIEMVIEYGNNASASLLVRACDDPVTLAKRFCFKYNIDPRIIGTLASNIRSLQSSSFTNNNNYKIERNRSRNDDKENTNNSNFIRRDHSRSQEKSLQNSKIRRSRSKTGQSSHNDSGVLELSRSGTDPANNNPGSSMKYNVFERLYRDCKKKNTTKGNETANATNKNNGSRMSLNTTNNQNKSLNESSIQSCVHIYEKNTKLKEESKKHFQHLHELNQQKELEKCRFQPAINPLSNLIANKLRDLDESNTINRSTNDKQMMKIKQYLLEREKQQMKECTFKPKIITKISNYTSTGSTQRFLQLYDEHTVREAKKKLMSQKSSKENEREHHPTINNISKVIVNKSFFERLQEDSQKRRQSAEKMGRSRKTQRRPSTGRPPAHRNLGDKTIGQYLYEKSRPSRVLSTKQPPKILTDPHSEQLYTKSKHLAVQYIFQLLDSDQDGLISSTKINISALGEQVLRLLAPLLSEMEEVGVELNMEQFMMAFERLFTTFSVGEKNTIMKVSKSKELGSRASEQPSFNPTLNEFSLRMARQLCNDDTDIYESSMHRIRERENKMNRLRAERMLEEYSQCTFHPRIHQ